MSHESQTDATDRSHIEPFIKIVQAIDGGRVLFWLLLGSAGYMFLTAAQFSSAAQMFPRLTAGIVLVAGVLRVASTYLDLDIQQSENIALGGSTPEQDTPDATNPGETNVDTMVVLALLIIGYIIGGYFVGLFWVTPPFVFGYMAYTDQPWWQTLLCTALMTGIAYAFMIIMNLDLMVGRF